MDVLRYPSFIVYGPELPGPVVILVCEVELMSISHVTVLGAGWCGLAAALKCQKAGLKTLVLEMQPQVGGLAKTIVWKGFRVDLGASSFFTTEKKLADEFRSLMGATFQTSLKRNVIWFQNRWITYPLDLRSIFHIPMTTLAQATAEYIALQLRYNLPFPLPQGEPKTTRSNRYGQVLDQLLMSEYTRKIWESPAYSLRPSWSSATREARSPIDQMRSLLEGLFQRRAHHTATFHNPAEGISSISEKMKSTIEQAGGTVRTNAQVYRVLAPDGEVEAVHYHHHGGEHWQQTDYVFSTIPLPSLFPLLSPLPSHGLTESAFQLRHRALIFLHILHEDNDVDPFLHYFFPEEKFPFFRASYATPVSTSSMGHQLACLNVEWLLEPEDPLYDASPQELLDVCRPRLEETGLLKDQRILEIAIHREPHAMPIYDESIARHLREVQSHLTGIRRLRAIGRQGNFDNATLVQVARMGFQAARGIIDETDSARRPRERNRSDEN